MVTFESRMFISDESLMERRLDHRVNVHFCYRLARGVKRRSLQPTISTTSSTDSQYAYVQGSFMERAGASMEKALESFFTSWGTCKFILL